MKRDVSDYLELAHAVYLDACAKCDADPSDLRDLMTMRSRTENEGISFLTITLPSFAKDFERSLAEGVIDSSSFRSFRKLGAIPAFMSGMLSRVFSRETGRILDENADTSTIVDGVRQVCLLFKKILLPCTPEREAQALENFVQIEHSNESFTVPSDEREYFKRVSEVLWTGMLGNISPSELVPRHGPGATAERITGNFKYAWRYWYERLESHFPFLGFGYTLGFASSDPDVTTIDQDLEFEKVTFVPEQDEQPVRVVLVPKTLKSPRVIAIEPVCMQYAQQAVKDSLVERIETYWLTRGHVNFTNQKINQKRALTSSKTGRYATIDLSDASDRVLNDLAMEMFDSNPDLRDAIQACRSRKAQLPDGRLVGPLIKFASMGSALCFPVESMYFYTICVVALLRHRNLPVTFGNVKRVSRRIYVYGDDLIVPADEASSVLDHLRKYNCKVNDSKSFWTGRFRESCGVDAYAGKEVTPLYVRHPIPRNRQQAAELISWVATANHFYKKGYWRTATLMYCTCEKVLGPLPYVSPDSSALGKISYLGYRTANGWNDKTHSLKVRGWVPKVVYRSAKVDSYPALMKCLLSLEHKSRSREEDTTWSWLNDDLEDLMAKVSSVDKHHLERSARRGAVTLKLRWVPVT